MYEHIMDQWKIPEDHTRQMNSLNIIRETISKNSKIQKIMDLGCGTGGSKDFFTSINPTVDWYGLDIKVSPEVNHRTRDDINFYTFDGVNIPFSDNYFDLIYCNQVLEHVQYPEKLLIEVQRVLKKDGMFIGSTSQFEPYHSYSIWNYTPYGFKLLIEEAQLHLLEIRPGIDALTLIARSGLGRPMFFSRWWNKESPLNQIIGLIGWLTKKTNKEINFAKLLFCGQFCFIAKKV